MLKNKEYKLVIQINKDVCDFEREFIAYVTGILDDVQMDGDGYAIEEQKAFWKEEFNLNNFSGQNMYNGKSSYISFSAVDENEREFFEFNNFVDYLDKNKIPTEYNLYADFLRFICRDDDIEAWHQSFYGDDWSSEYPLKDKSGNDINCLIIYLKKELDSKWENILIKRILKYLNYDVQEIILLDQNNNIIKKFI